ncbi:hypothetical protein RHD99_19120 [Buttiauxella selenatireducens]|uniref:Uncharacterized protein n=1 Tax=Buttiauxella selenatireducens TaxID=3073902 RepID=A0ABY9S852_9ENTR|nr:hypothetical protein [Buttiauxella sp. R73]WMY73539.1 hypothetical protein RHD99_19120 [Buttiauxella sp. R73]
MKNSFWLSDFGKQTELITSISAIARSVIFGSVFILATNTVLQPVMASTDTTNSKVSESLSVPQTKEARVALFQQAVADDLAGRNSAARKAWDVLKNTDMAAQSAVPSAINLAALGKFDAASTAFDALTASSNTRESDYARLWQLWLTARTHVGKSAALKKELAILASGMNVSSPGQQALIRLYAGKGSTDAVFAAIAAMPGTDELQRRDALTEATFFTGGYLQFVTHDNKAALQLYEREQNHLNSTSLETPLINKAAATLQAAKH